MGQIDDIASDIYDTELYDESKTSQQVANEKARISAWLETNIGQLNVLINSSYRIDGNNDACPVLNDEEVAIFIQLYLKYYYKRQSQSILKNLSTSVISTAGTPLYTMSDWTELREGDSAIKRVSQTASPQQKVQIAQAYKGFSSEADIKLSELIHAYNMYKSAPRQVVSDGLSSASIAPTPT